MITKIKRLKSIGKFYNFSGKGDALDWHKNTFVFAPNAYGKTTLVNVLRSLCDNYPKLISARKTLGVATEAEAIIKIDGTDHVFRGTEWKPKYHQVIQIFDVDFIHKNILFTHEISHDHKKNIHKIIVGVEGVTLAKELEALQNDEKVKKQEYSVLTERFKRGGFKLSLDKLRSTPPADEASVDSRIHTLEQNIESKNSETVVRGLDHPQRLPNIPNAHIDLSTAGIVAKQKLPSFHEAAEKQVLAHIDRNFEDKTQAMQFIRRGMDLRQADCPFCGQDLKNATDLLKAYREFFDDSYRKYQQSVAEQLAALSGWNIDNELTALGAAYNLNLAALRQWEPYLSTIVLPDIVATVNPCRVRLVELKGKVQSELEKKQKDPNADADLSQFEALTTELARLKTAVEGYNAEVFSFIEKAKQCIADLPKSDVDVLQVELDKEKEIKKWFEPEWQIFATDYTAAEKIVQDLTDQKNAKKKEIETSSRGIYDTYQIRINELLERLGTDFTIKGLTGKTDARANASYSNFGFLILEQTVPLTPKQNNDGPCFSNTLSEGDKSTLAFAFFIAALEKNPKRDQQIVIFDDPLSSLDETRREATASLLFDLSHTVNQLNVFTHKWDFLCMLCDRMLDNKVLCISSDTKNGSQLEVYNMEEKRKSTHARMLEDMESYTKKPFGSVDTMQGNIRKIFETVLKTKYYLVLAMDIKQNRSLSTLLTTLFKKGLLDEKLRQPLFNLRSVANDSHHGKIVDATPTKLSEKELSTLIKQALDLIHKV